MAASPPIKAKRELCNEQSKSAKQVMKDRQRESDKLLFGLGVQQGVTLSCRSDV